MFEKIQQKLSSKFDLNEKRGLFLSCFDENGNLIFSKGFITTDFSIKENINKLLEMVSQKKAKVFVCDVVKNIIEVSDIQQIKNINVKEWGICVVVDDLYGVMLPNTKGVPDSLTAISLILKKNKIKAKTAEIYKFNTERFVVDI